MFEFYCSGIVIGSGASRSHASHLFNPGRICLVLESTGILRLFEKALSWRLARRMSDVSEISELKSEPVSHCASLETWYTRHTLYYGSLSQDVICRILQFICEQINKYKLMLSVSRGVSRQHTVTPTHTSLVVSACPIPVVSRCYLSLTCHSCHILMDGKQIG